MSQHLLSYGDCLLDPEDLKLLEDNEWLNDKVINFALEYFTNTIINKSQSRNDILLCCAEVIQLTKHSPDDFVEVILADLHLPSKQWIVMPINDNESLDESGGSHWSVLFYDKKEESFYHLDSLHHHNYQTACAVAAKISTLLKVPEEKQHVIKSNTPVQLNGYDCGMFVIKIAEVLATGLTGGQSIPWESLNAIKPGAMHEYRKHLAGIIKDLAASNDELS